MVKYTDDEYEANDLGFKQGYKKAVEEVDKILQKEIDDEKDVLNRKEKVIRNWSILNELIYIKDILLKSKDKK